MSIHVDFIGAIKQLCKKKYHSENKLILHKSDLTRKKCS